MAESRNHCYSKCFGRALGLEVNKRVTSGAPNILKGGAEGGMEGGVEGGRTRVRPVLQYLSPLSAGFQWRDLREILYVQEILKHNKRSLSVYPGVPGA